MIAIVVQVDKESTGSSVQKVDTKRLRHIYQFTLCILNEQTIRQTTRLANVDITTTLEPSWLNLE